MSRTFARDHGENAIKMVEAASAIRAAGVDAVRENYKVRLEALRLEQARLAAKYGASSARATEASRHLEAYQRLGPSIEAEAHRTAMKAPQPAADRFILYGRVVDAAENGLPSLTVAAVGSSGSALAQAVTGDQGDFELDVPISPSTPAKSGGLPPKIETKPTSESVDPAIITFQVQVADHQNKVLLKGEEVFELEPNRVVYRELVVGAAGR